MSLILRGKKSQALIVYVCVCVCQSLVMSDSLRPHGLQPASLLCPWDFPGKNTGVSCHFLLQGIFPTTVSNPRLLHCRWILQYYTWEAQISTTLDISPPWFYGSKHTSKLINLHICIKYVQLFCKAVEKQIPLFLILQEYFHKGTRIFTTA